MFWSEFLDKDFKKEQHSSDNKKMSGVEMSITESYVIEFSKTRTAINALSAPSSLQHPVTDTVNRILEAAVTERDTFESLFLTQYGVMEENRRRLSSQNSLKLAGAPSNTFKLQAPSRPMSPLFDEESPHHPHHHGVSSNDRKKRITFKVDSSMPGTHEQVLSEESYDLHLDGNWQIDERGITERDGDDAHDHEADEMITPTVTGLDTETSPKTPVALGVDDGNGATSSATAADMVQRTQITPFVSFTDHGHKESVLTEGDSFMLNDERSPKHRDPSLHSVADISTMDAIERNDTLTLTASRKDTDLASASDDEFIRSLNGAVPTTTVLHHGRSTKCHLGTVPEAATNTPKLRGATRGLSPFGVVDQATGTTTEREPEPEPIQPMEGTAVSARTSSSAMPSSDRIDNLCL